MKWTFPIAKWGSRVPVISSEYREPSRPDHNGVDIMFRRQPSDVDLPPGSPNGSKGGMFVMPDDASVVAAADGVLWSAGWSATGYVVVVDHGKPYATCYRHLESLDVPVTKAGEGKLPIAAGQRLGTVGASPLDKAKLKHLHFEVWQGGGYESNVDPAPFIRDAPVVSLTAWTKLAALFAGLLALFGFTKRGGGNVPTS